MFEMIASTRFDFHTPHINRRKCSDTKSSAIVLDSVVLRPSSRLYGYFGGGDARFRITTRNKCTGFFMGGTHYARDHS